MSSQLSQMLSLVKGMDLTSSGFTREDVILLEEDLAAGEFPYGPLVTKVLKFIGENRAQFPEELQATIADITTPISAADSQAFRSGLNALTKSLVALDHGRSNGTLDSEDAHEFSRAALRDFARTSDLSAGAAEILARGKRDPHTPDGTGFARSKKTH